MGLISYIVTQLQLVSAFVVIITQCYLNIYKIIIKANVFVFYALNVNVKKFNFQLNFPKTK